MQIKFLNSTEVYLNNKYNKPIKIYYDQYELLDIYKFIAKSNGTFHIYTELGSILEVPGHLIEILN